MLWHILATTMLLLGGFGQALGQDCLHLQNETATDRARREQALQFARRLNAAQYSMLPGPDGQKYRQPDELRNLPPVPPGFQLQFHTDGRRYAFSLKDGRDACRFAVFSDQDGYVYAASPQQPAATIIPLDTQ
ncbi:MAG TPA: hypothetical protein VIK60_03370 [Vicinamibacterales bacterium]